MHQRKVAENSDVSIFRLIRHGFIQWLSSSLSHNKHNAIQLQPGLIQIIHYELNEQ